MALAFFAKESAARRTLQDLDTALEADIAGHVEGCRLVVDEGIAARVHERMAALSRHIDAHSHSPDFHEVPLTLELVTGELAQFDGIKSDYGKARKEWEKTKPKAATVFS